MISEVKDLKEDENIEKDNYLVKDITKINVIFNNKNYSVKKNTLIIDFIQNIKSDIDDYLTQNKYISKDILLVNINNKLFELLKPITKDCEIKILTYDDKAARKAYERTAIFMAIAAFNELYGENYKYTLEVCFSTGNGIYFRAKNGFILTDEVICNIEKTMFDMVSKNMVIHKSNYPVEEGLNIFNKNNMFDKEGVISFRRSSRVNIYSLNGYKDYFYGEMLPYAKYVDLFKLTKYDEGFVLLVPEKNNPKIVSEFKPVNNVFNKLKASSILYGKLGISNVGSLNKKICNGYTNDLVLMSEAFMEKEIADIAKQIYDSDNVKFVMIAGPTSSGKTTFSKRLSIQLRSLGLKPIPIEVDNYFKNRIDTPRDENGEYNFETIDAIDIELLNRHMTDVLNGKEIELPYFNFKKGEREYRGEFLKLDKDSILILEGIHCLNDDLCRSINNSLKFKVYISALTQLNIDNHNRISTTDGRLLRRIIRDARTRGMDAAQTIKMWDSVRAGEEKYIFPFQDTADVVFNSALSYELSALKQYAEPLLFGIDRSSPEYLEAKRLLKLLDYFLTIPCDLIPLNSIIREFIGGSCF